MQRSSLTRAGTAVIGTKTKAVLAGALVLGVGTVATLASWNAEEFAIGAFGSGHFELEGSNGVDAFASHATEAGAAELSFEVDADKLSPTTTVYAPFAVRLSDDTTNAAVVEVDGVVQGAAIGDNTAGIGDNLSFTVKPLSGADATCGEDLAVESITSFELNDTVGTTAYLCLAVTADAGLEQDGTGTIAWTFTAESTEEILASAETL